MSTGNLKWFLGLSAAAHLAVLGVQAPRLIEFGHSGPVLRLEMVNIAGTPAVTMPPPRKKPPPSSPRAAPAATANVPPVHPVASLPRPAVQPVASASTDKQASSAAPSPEIVAAAPERTDTGQHLRDTLLKLVTARLHYPPIARRRGWQGTVVLQLRIEPDGLVSRLSVDASSGYPVLDRAAMECLRLASIPQPERWLHGRAVELLVPVEYRLVDG